LQKLREGLDKNMNKFGGIPTKLFVFVFKPSLIGIKPVRKTKY
jgi:hypothetical protein